MRIVPLLLLGPTALMMASPLLHQTAGSPSEANSNSLDLYEAVIRFQVKAWQPSIHTYCVKINGADPDAALRQRLRALHVKGASACEKLKENGQMTVVDAKKKQSVIFDLGAVQNVSDSKVELQGGYLCGNVCMAQGTYRAFRDRYGWHVAGFEAQLTF
ncbi:hypothetical protein P8935_14095 [Telmatobacter sp. DSM 110680]|uniref:Uncharacterized protein n=1 Tax=Telmatobacter sp. DSM 110680 TaxID=3036704 RepID=A0AAU7DE98_9BACT